MRYIRPLFPFLLSLMLALASSLAAQSTVSQVRSQRTILSNSATVGDTTILTYVTQDSFRTRVVNRFRPADSLAMALLKKALGDTTTVLVSTRAALKVATDSLAKWPKPDTTKPTPPPAPDPTPTPPPPPSGPGEPTPSGKIIKADNFDSYTGNRPGSPWDCTPGESDVQMVAGRTGKAFRLVYTPSNFYSGCDLQFSTIGRIMVSYWFRINPVGYNIIEGDNTGSGMKWFTLWRPTAPRQTWGANQLGGVSAPTFGTHDNSSSNMPNPVNGPSGLWNNVNDGQWHRYTIEAVTGSNGYEKCWLDGVLIFDTSGRGYNRSSEGFNLLQIGHDKVRAPLGTRYLDIDDFAAWAP